MRTLLATLAAAALAVFVWTIWARPDPPPANAPSTPNDAPRIAQGTVDRATSITENDDRIRVQLPAAESAASTGTLRVKLLWPDGTAGAGEQLTVEPGLAAESNEAIDVTTGPDGCATVTSLPPGPGQVRLDSRGGARFAITVGAITECEIAFAPGVDVHGVVVDENGQPIPTARIWLSRFGRGDEGQEVLHVNRDGTFLLRAVRPSLFLAAVAPQHRGSTLIRVQGEGGNTQDVRIELRLAGVSLLGRVLLPGSASAPAKRARVLVGRRDMSNAWEHESFTREYRPPTDLRCDDQGAFRADGLAPGSNVAVWLRAAGTATLLQTVTMPTDRDLVAQFDLAAGATLRGRATDESEKPVAGASVVARSDALWDLERADRFFFGPSWANSATKTRADGSYELAHVAAGNIRVDALQSEPQRNAATKLPAMDGQQIRWDPVLTAGASIKGRVVDEQSEPLVGWTVVGTAAEVRRATTDAAGNFELPGCGDTLWRVAVQAPGSEAKYISQSRTNVRGGTTDLVMVVALRAIPDATITGRVTAADGTPPKRGVVSYWRQGAMATENAAVEADGTFRIGLIPAGSYRVRAVADAVRAPWSEPFALRRGETLDLGPLRPGPTGSVRATVADEGGKPMDDVECQIVERIEGLDQPFAGGRTRAGIATIDGLQPGAYRLRIAGRNQPIVNAPFVVVAGEQSEVAITVQRSVACMLRLSAPSEGAPLQLSFTWSRNGEVFLQHTSWWQAREELVLPRRLVPGDYVIAIVSETGKTQENRFSVTANDRDGHEIEVRLP